MKGLIGTLTLLLVGCLLGGCVFGGHTYPTMSIPPPVTYSTPPPPPTSPTSRWTPEEQAAIDAVDRYWAVWANIGQNLETADWNAIKEVAGDSITEGDLQTWQMWHENGWYLVGSPTFVPDGVTPGDQDDQGQRQQVHGCFIIADSRVVDSQGEPIAADDRIERGTVAFTVIRTSAGAHSLIEENSEREPC